MSNRNSELSDAIKISEIIKDNKSKEIVLSHDILIINGGEPPKFFKKYGLNINSTFEKDIVIIEFRKKDTIGLKIPFNNFFNKKSIFLENIEYFKGDSLAIIKVNNNLVIKKKRFP
ncbi:hypothetical protein A8C32_09445 [Flavivirga aquatica]|uniref:Uncharacterized protein n=1 Tax=Flavivirga aquatica TaxID=1849968 RepID=A0A1E5SJS4_9FLAO|nr:hypothetical protein [Flavivirga aquatica]OEJ99375.1 hypothetical protein A8C32_09445 [Flavivirga aquatica]